MTSEGRALVLSKVTEAQWQKQVITWAKRANFLIHHVHDSRTQEWDTNAGIPDLILVHRLHGRCIFAELKTERGSVSLVQTQWIAALKQVVGVECYVWRPSDEATVKELLRMSVCA